MQIPENVQDFIFAEFRSFHKLDKLRDDLTLPKEIQTDLDSEGSNYEFLWYFLSTVFQEYFPRKDPQYSVPGSAYTAFVVELCKLAENYLTISEHKAFQKSINDWRQVIEDPIPSVTFEEIDRLVTTGC